MDSINQIGKTLAKMQSEASHASKRDKVEKRVERASDTFDFLVPFSMDFRATDKEATYLSLYFKTPAPSRCCGTCYCSVCEQFTNVIDVSLTYGYISGTINIFDLDTNMKVTDYVEVNPDAGTLHLNTTGNYRICYIYFAGGCAEQVSGLPCGQMIFDDFSNRILGDGWGNASSGPTYTITGSGNSSVNSGAVLEAAPNASIEADVASPLSFGMDYTITIEFFVFNNVANANFVFGGLNFGWRESATYPTVQNHDTIYLWDGSGGELTTFVGTGSDDIWHNSPMQDSTWGFIKVDKFGEHVRAKIWGDAGAEPGWMLEGDLDDLSILTGELVSVTANTSGAGEVDFGYIQFDITCV